MKWLRNNPGEGGAVVQERRVQLRARVKVQLREKEGQHHLELQRGLEVFQESVYITVKLALRVVCSSQW